MISMEGKEKRNSKALSYIDSALPAAALYEQLAEEATELAKAALKMARIIRDENPTPVTHDDAMANLVEEIGDVRLCIRVLGLDGRDTSSIERSKLARWVSRTRKHTRSKRQGLMRSV